MERGHNTPKGHGTQDDNDSVTDSATFKMCLSDIDSNIKHDSPNKK